MRRFNYFSRASLVRNCGNTVNFVFRNYIFFGQLFFFYDATINNQSLSFGCQRGRISQRWSPRGRPWPRGRPRGQILKSLALALASKVKSLALASRPQVLENWPVLGSRTALFFGKLKFCGAVEKFFGKRFFVEIA